MEAIFTGKVRNWSQVSGATATGPIDVYSRTSVAGVLTTFQNTTLRLGGAKVSPVATQEASEGLMQNAVKKDPSAIGFLSDYFALAKGINPVGYNGTGCSVANVVSEAPTRESPTSTRSTKGAGRAARTEAFINWIQHSSTAKKIIETNWIPLGKLMRPPSRRLLGSASRRARAPATAQALEGSIAPSRLLGTVACVTFVAIVLMVVFVAQRAWPTFSHEGLSWLGPGGNVDNQISSMVNTTVASAPASAYHLRAWPLICNGTAADLRGLAVILGLVISLLTAIFVVDLAPARPRPARDDAR